MVMFVFVVGMCDDVLCIDVWFDDCVDVDLFVV